jgi:hypothetical protein
MAHSSSREITRNTRKLIKGTSATLSRKARGRDRQVRRDSYDIGDRRAQVFRPIADGTIKGGLGWADDMLKLATEFDIVHKKRGERGPLQANGVRVLQVLLFKCLNFKTGQLDHALVGIARLAGLSKNAVIAALNRLRKHGFLNWIRRSEKTDNAGEYGPQRKQVSNAYFFDLAGLAKGAIQRFRDLRERRRRRQENDTPVIQQAILPASSVRVPKDPEIAALLAALGASIENASS